MACQTKNTSEVARKELIDNSMIRSKSRQELTDSDFRFTGKRRVASSPDGEGKEQTINGGSLSFNPQPSNIMHLDLNSCFATIEQQANPHLRGKPVAVAAYNTPSGCIVAPSVEAKRLGIKVGMRVRDGKLIYPRLIILPPDPWKYRNVHLKLKKLLSDYTDKLVPKSIDEFNLDFEGLSAFNKGLINVAQEIKQRIQQEIGDWLTVSIGIAPNRFLAKTAANLHKPDGLNEINQHNFLQIYSRLSLTNLCGIKKRNAARLNSFGVHTVLDFYQAPVFLLRAAFSSILGYYWYLRLRGWEIDDVEFGRRSYSNSFTLPKPLVSPEQLSSILQKLVEKMGARLRKAGYQAKGVHVSLLYRDWSHWHQGKTLKKIVFDSREIYMETFKILLNCPYRKPVRDLAVSCFNLVKADFTQLELFQDPVKKKRLAEAVDKINERWGNFVITPARMLGTQDLVPDRVAYGGIKELEEIKHSGSESILTYR